MITLNSLSKIYRTDEIETVALENVNLTVERGEFLSIMGPSGCGKSTLLNIMGLLDAPTMGTVSYTHLDVYKRQPIAMRKATSPRRCWVRNQKVPITPRKIFNNRKKRIQNLSLIHIFSHLLLGSLISLDTLANT